MAKSIVKVNWLPAPLDGSELQARLLQGDVAQWLTRYEGREREYLLAKSSQIAGRPSQILEALGKLDPHPTNELDLELLFLKGFAFSRLGRVNEAQKIFGTLPKQFQAKILIEKGLERLNRGEFISAEVVFKKALEKGAGDFDPYSACTLFGGLSLTLIHQGSFGEAEACLRERRRLLLKTPSESLLFGTRLYEILLLLERNQFEGAAELLSKTLGELERDSINSYFILHLKLRLHIARNELEKAEENLQDLRQTAEKLNLSEGVLDFRLEEIELLLRKNESIEAARRIESLKSDAVRMRDQFLRFRLAVLNAVLLIQKRDVATSIKEISQAIEIGEIHRYRPTMTWALFHAAGIAAATGHLNSF
jgi:tetratricopeptide (TPR) repeat protein